MNKEEIGVGEVQEDSVNTPSQGSGLLAVGSKKDIADRYVKRQMEDYLPMLEADLRYAQRCGLHKRAATLEASILEVKMQMEAALRESRTI